VVPAPPDHPDSWLAQWQEAHELVTSWERKFDRLLPTAQACELMREICVALQRAYERGNAEARGD